MEESGQSCVANAAHPGWTLIGFNPRQIFPVPLYELPTRVITSWKIEVAPGTLPLAQQLVAFERVSENEVRKTGESSVESVAGGTSEFPTRIPFQGLHPLVGTQGSVETLYCAEEHALSGVVEEPFAVGEIRRYKVDIGVGTPLTVTVEPDRDGDGYGDLTQDRCLPLAAVHDACPFVRLSPHVTAITKRAILLQISTGDPTTVQVSGRVDWPRRHRRARTRSAPGPNDPAEAIVNLNGGSQPVGTEPGVTFTVPLPVSVRHKLAKMAPEEKLKASLTIVATDVASRQTTRNMTVRLPGRKVGGRKH
jgi:hypothetical protein